MHALHSFLIRFNKFSNNTGWCCKQQRLPSLSFLNLACELYSASIIYEESTKTRFVRSCYLHFKISNHSTYLYHLEIIHCWASIHRLFPSDSNVNNYWLIQSVRLLVHAQFADRSVLHYTVSCGSRFWFCFIKSNIISWVYLIKNWVFILWQ